MFKEVMVDNFSKLMTGTKLQIQNLRAQTYCNYEKTNKNFQTQLYDIQTDKKTEDL